MHGRILLQFSKRAPPISTINPKVQSYNPQKSPNTNHKRLRFQQLLQNFDEDLSNRFTSLLKNCQGPSDLHKGRQIHAQIIANGLNSNSYLDTRVLGMYILCRGFSDAKDVFFRVDRRSSAPWNWMIRGFTVVGWFEFALLFYFKMRVFGVLPDNCIYPYVIKSCCGLSAFSLGIMIRGTIRSLGLEKDLKVGGYLIHVYAQSGRISEAREVFDGMPQRDCVLWNVTVDGYKKIGDKKNAIRLFRRMRMLEVRPNSVSFTTVLSLSSDVGMLNYGTQLHGLVIKCGVGVDALVTNTLVSLYSKSQCLFDVSKLLSSMPQNDLVAWNAIISGCVQNGLNQEALDLFYRMRYYGVKPDSVTFTSFFPSFSDTASLKSYVSEGTII